jgi:hypothetical protein
MFIENRFGFAPASSADLKFEMLKKDGVASAMIIPYIFIYL